MGRVEAVFDLIHFIMGVLETEAIVAADAQVARHGAAAAAWVERMEGRAVALNAAEGG